MTTQNINLNDAMPVKTATAAPNDIISQQRAAGWSEFLLKIQVSPLAVASGTTKPQEYLDGMVLAENTTNLVGLDGGAGKSTSTRHAGIMAASTGYWPMFGHRQHAAPLRVAMVFGEETKDQIIQSINAIPGAYEHYLSAIGSGRLLIISMSDYYSRADITGRPELMFDKEGSPTATGNMFLQEIAGFRPDVLILDTLGSVSESEYLDSLSPRNTINALNRFCDKNRCTCVAYLHLTKDAGGRFTADSSPDELLALSRGSAQMKNTTRSLIVATRAPAGMYPGIEVGPDDEIWVGTTKCNLQGAKYNYKFFPIIRDAAGMILTAHDASGGGALADTAEQAKKAATRALIEYLPHLIRAASDYRKPFPVSTRHKFSLQGMLTGPMSSYFEETLSAGIITGALEALVKEGKIVEASNTRSGSGLVYCYPGGPFAEQAAYQERTGSKLTVREGDYPIEELKNGMHKLHDAARDGTEAPAWIADAEAAEAERKQAEAAKKSAADEKAAEAKAKAEQADAVKRAAAAEKAAKARAKAEQDAADEQRRAAARAVTEAKRIATMQRDAAKRELAAAEADIEKHAQPLKIAKANLNAARVRAEKDKSPEAAAKIDEFIAVLADVEGEAQVAEIAKNDAAEKLKAAESELIKISEKALADAKARAYALRFDDEGEDELPL